MSRCSAALALGLILVGPVVLPLLVWLLWRWS